jgi:hypothetical protein
MVMKKEILEAVVKVCADRGLKVSTEEVEGTINGKAVHDKLNELLPGTVTTNENYKQTHRRLMGRIRRSRDSNKNEWMIARNISTILKDVIPERYDGGWKNVR